jgi:hypothetical protein
MADTIYIEARYLEGKLLCERFVVRAGLTPSGNTVGEFPDIRKAAKYFARHDVACQNLTADEIESSRGGLMLRRSLTPTELEYIALHASKQAKEQTG